MSELADTIAALMDEKALDLPREELLLLLKDLNDRLCRLEAKVDGIQETNHLWDGS